MAAGHQVLLGSKHDMAIVRAIRGEEGKERAVLAFLMRPLGIAPHHFILIHRIAGESRRILKETAPRLSQSHFPRAEARLRVPRRFNFGEIGIARCFSMIGFIYPEECERARCAGFES